jgi:hypothetical protein
VQRRESQRTKLLPTGTLSLKRRIAGWAAPERRSQLNQ